MGCDIHMHIEIKVAGQWHHYNHPRVERRYWIFSRMAGVRYAGPNSGDPTPLTEPRGIPDDIHLITSLEYRSWEGDAHSESWLSGEELDLIEQEVAEKWRVYAPFGYLFGNGFDLENRESLKVDLGIEDVRAVFWFDN